MRIFIVAGEPSGDLHGAHLAAALRAHDPHIDLDGVGGTRMRQAGVRLLMESEHWGVIGIPQAVRKFPELYRNFHRLLRLLRADPPDVLVPIDFGAFNVPLLRKLQGSGIRVVYFIPPGSWSRSRPAGQLPFLVDGIATPFPWSADNLRAAGAPARIEWVGHPLIDYCRPSCSREEARARLGVEADRPVVALVPGSRRAELRHLLPVFLQACRLLPHPLCLLTVAPSLGARALRPLLPADLDIRLLDGMDYDQLQAADAALAASGTATLELACLGLPMVVAYRGDFLTWVQYRIVARGGRLRFISLPNILADEPVVPERLQESANPTTLAGDLTPLLSDTSARLAQVEAFARIRGLLGEGGACARAAELVLEIGTRKMEGEAPA
ncbi:MAG: lipid-A-disaccharide synthase [Armatimonadota bacterium]